MSRTVATVIALMLALPVIVFVAAGAAVGLNPNIYSGAIGFIVGVCFIGAVLLEVYRLATTRPEDLAYGWMAKQVAVAPISTATADQVERTRVEVIREPIGGNEGRSGSRLSGSMTLAG